MKYAIVFSLFFFDISAFANIDELYELNLAKAQLHKVDGNEKAFKLLISKNLSLKNPHLPSFFALSEYYFSKGLIKKGFNVFYLLIKSEHSKNLLKLRHGKDFERYLSTQKKPNKLAKYLYFTIAQKYFSLWESNKNEPYSIEYIQMAKKYFSICAYFNYAPEFSNFYLGQIFFGEEKFSTAIKKFLKAKKLNTNFEIPINEIDYWLANSYLNEGHIELGKHLYRSILSTPGPKYLNEYAREYTSYLSESSFDASITYSLSKSSNVYSLSDSEKSSINEFSESIGTIDGNYQSFEADFIYIGQKNNNRYTLFSLEANLTQYSNELHKTLETRSINTAFEIVWDAGKFSSFHLKYSPKINQYRPTITTYKTFSLVQTISPSLIFHGQKSKITLEGPIVFSDEKTGNDTYSFGIDIGIDFLTFNKYFFPSTSIGAHLLSESDEGAENSTQINFNFANSISFSDRVSLYSSLELSQYSNNDPNLAYFSYLIYNSLQYRFKKFPSLTSSINQSFEVQNEENGDSTKSSLVALSATFNF